MSRDAAIEWDTINEFEEQLDSIPGVTVNTVEALQTSNVAIDFSFEWPDRAPAEWPPLRYNAVENSAIILEQTIYVSEWQLRLAPIPQEGNPADAVEGKLKRRFERILDNQVTVRLASDGDVWTPHVHSMAMWSPEAEKVIADIGQLWDSYRDMVEGGEFGVV